MYKDSHLADDKTNSFNRYGCYWLNTNYNSHQAGTYFDMELSEDDCFRACILIQHWGFTVRPVSF